MLFIGIDLDRFKGLVCRNSINVANRCNRMLNKTLEGIRVILVRFINMITTTRLSFTASPACQGKQDDVS